MAKIDETLKSLGIELPDPPPPAGNYVGSVTFGTWSNFPGMVLSRKTEPFSAGRCRQKFRLKVPMKCPG